MRSKTTTRTYWKKRKKKREEIIRKIQNGDKGAWMGKQIHPNDGITCLLEKQQQTNKK